MSAAVVVRLCRHCGRRAGETPEAEPICNRGGLVGPHSYVDVRLGPCACPDCGWHDGGELHVEDWWAEAYPPGPRPRGLATFHVIGDPEHGARLFCPRCDCELEPDTVAARTDPVRVIDLGGVGARYWRVVSDHGADHPDARAAAVHARATGSVGCTYNGAKVERA